MSPIPSAPAKPLIWISYQRDVPRREREKKSNLILDLLTIILVEKSDVILSLLSCVSHRIRREYLSSCVVEPHRFAAAQISFLCYWNKLKSVAKSPRLVKKEYSTWRKMVAIEDWTFLLYFTILPSCKLCPTSTDKRKYHKKRWEQKSFSEQQTALKSDKRDSPLGMWCDEEKKKVPVKFQ